MAENNAIMFTDNGNLIDSSKIVRIANNNVRLYMDYMGWGQKQRKAFMNTYSDVINNIANGTINSRDAGLEWHDNSGKLANSSDDFDAVGEVLYFLDPIVNNVSEDAVVEKRNAEIKAEADAKKAEEEAKAEAEAAEAARPDYSDSIFDTYFNAQKFGGVTPSLEQWQQTWVNLDTADDKGVRGDIERKKALSELMPGYKQYITSKNYRFPDTMSLEQYLAGIDAALAALANDDPNDDVAALSKIGIDLTKYTGNYVSAAAQQQEQALDYLNAVKATNEWFKQSNVYMSLHYGTISFKPDEVAFGELTDDERELAMTSPPKGYSDLERFAATFGKYLSGRTGTGDESTGYKYTQYFKDRLKTDFKIFLVYATNTNTYEGLIIPNDDGHTYYIVNSFNSKTHTGWVYDKDTNKLIKKSVENISALKLSLSDKYIKEHPNEAYERFKEKYGILDGTEGGNWFSMPQMLQPTTTESQVQSAKKGGIIKAQQGTSLEYYAALKQASTTRHRNNIKSNTTPDFKNYEEWEKWNKEQNDATSIANRKAEFATGRTKYKTEEDYLHRTDPHESFDWEDYGRLAAVAMDIGSLIASWAVGDGTVAGLALGMGSTGINFAADLADGENFWSAAGTAALNLGTDVVSLIPGFGTVAETHKIAKTLLKYTNRVLYFAGLAGATSEVLGGLKVAFDKLHDGKDLTLDDWRTIALGIKGALSLTKAGREAYKTYEVKKNLDAIENKDRKISIKINREDGTSGELPLDVEKLNQLKEAKTIDKQNELIKQWSGGATAAQTSGYFKWKSASGITQEPKYDWSKFNETAGNENHWWTPAGRVKADVEWDQPNVSTGIHIPTPKWMGTGIKVNKNGGILYAKEGEVLGVATKSDASTWGNSVGTVTFEEILKRLEKDAEYYKTINQAQTEHAVLRDRAKGKWDANRSYTDATNDISSYQTKYNNGNWNTIAIGPNYSRYDLSNGKRTSNDHPDKGWVSDNLFANITDDRRLLGRDEEYTADDVKVMNSRLAKYKLELFKDKDNYWKLKKIGEKDPSSIEGKTSSTGTPGTATGNSTGKKDNILKKLKLRERGTDLIPLIDLADTLNTNRKNFNDVYAAMTPYLELTPYYQGRILGDLAKMNFYNNEAARTRSMTSEAQVSDPTLRLLYALEGESKAQELQEKGYEADNERIATTSKESKAYIDTNIKNQNANANTNGKKLAETKLAKAEFKDQYRQQQLESRSNYRLKLYNNAKTKENNERQFAALAYQALNPTPAEHPQVLALQDLISKTTDTTQRAELQKQLDKVYNNATKQYTQNYYQTVGDLYGYSLPSLNSSYYSYDYSDPTSAVYTLKKGGTLDERKLLLKYDAMINKIRQKDKDMFNKQMSKYITEQGKNSRHLASEIASHLRNIYK